MSSSHQPLFQTGIVVEDVAVKTSSGAKTRGYENNRIYTIIVDDVEKSC